MMPFSSRVGELYDLFYRDKPYVTEAGFVDRLIRRHEVTPVKAVLELACGTGSHAIALARLGYDVTATDVCDSVIEQGRAKALHTGLQITFLKQDMRHLGIEGRQFDAAICLFDSIGYVVTNEGLGQVFEGVRRHLKPDGLFVFEFWHAAAMLSRYEPVRILRVKDGLREIVRISETTLDVEQQTARVQYTVLEPSADDGLLTSSIETHTNRFFLVQEMSAIAQTGGFESLAWHSGYLDDVPISGETWHIVAVTKKVS